MNVGEAVGLVHAGFDVDQAVKDVAELAGFDRYQASDGVMAAAQYVADRAEQAGLRDVRLLEFPADGAQRWWSFRSPRSWTPVRAELAGVARYPDQPFALAAYSAPTSGEGIVAPVVRLRSGELRGALVVHDDPQTPVAAAIELAARHGALGLVTDRLPGPGRIELPPGGPLVAFSLTSAQVAELVRRGRVRVVVQVHERAPMPLVTGVLPGEAAEEVLLSAHLCHPRPSVNDNASGAAALLGAAAVARDLPRRRGIRFVWGPEFTGMAAYLHDVATTVPVAAVNVDMAGQDQRRCGGPLIVERSPDHLPGLVNALAEHVVAALPQAARSYSGAVACDTWAWRATPFVGASDHSLLVDSAIACPTVSLGHWPDRFNHSAADTLDKLDPDELRRTATIACATAAVLAGAAGDRGELERIAMGWGAARVMECLPGRERATRGFLRHRTAVALGALDGLDALYGPGGGGSRDWLRALSGHLADLLPGEVPAGAGGPRLRRTWSGPFNLRGLAEAAGPAGRAWIDGQVAAERARSYALMLALAHGIDGERDRAAVATYAAHAAELPVPGEFANDFLTVLVEAGWAEEG
ncbi:DUF4910 domain-containing protein [Nonomuraea sp. NPDC003804]|uniref:DUF4910 domain-containing protein n=1 Tax=Nonomuraea sp. NPDC003804 TaxID=3154547 RepID=UPI0033B477B5